MSNAIKWGLRLAVAAALLGVGLAVLNLITQLPGLDFTYLSQGLRNVYAICDHYLPNWSLLWPSIVLMLTLDLYLLSVKAVISAQAFISKIFA